MSYYCVISSNMSDVFETIDEALDFVRDQLEMGFFCKVYPSEPTSIVTYTSDHTELLTHHDILAGDS